MAAAAAAAAADTVEITIVSAKHLKNVNWRNGPLVPYAAVYLSPNHRFSTLPDDSNSTRPIWNERFLLPYSSFSSPESILSLDVFHSSDTPKPLVGSLRIPSSSLLPDSPSSPSILHSLHLLRPSGRPQGKLTLKVSLRLPQFAPAPPSPLDFYSSPGASYPYYPPPPPPPPPVDYRVSHPPQPPVCNSDASSVYRPSAPVDFTYPAKELPDYRHTAVSPLPRIPSSDIAHTSGAPPHWISNRTALWRNDQNSVSLERERWVAPPSAPAGTPVYGYRRSSEEASVAGAFGGLRLDEGSRGHKSSNYGYNGYGYGRED